MARPDQFGWHIKISLHGLGVGSVYLDSQMELIDITCALLI